MPRKYIRKVGSRPYRNYSLTKIKEAVAACHERTITIRGAAKKYGVPISTISQYLKSKRENPDDSTVHIKKPGRPTVFTTEEERLMSAHIIALATYGSPVTRTDLKAIIKSYLEKRGRQVSVFTNNTPGDDWIDLFLKRHPNISHQTVHREALSDSFQDYLKTISSDAVLKKSRKRKLATFVGKGITAGNINIVEESPATKASATKKVNAKKGKDEKTISNISQSESSESDMDVIGLCSDETDDNEDYDEDNPQVQESTSSPILHKQLSQPPSKQLPLPIFGEDQLLVGDYVIVTYCGKGYPGKIIQKDGSNVEVTCMTKSGKWWTWPEKEDKVWFYLHSILRRIPVPKPVRGLKLMFSIDMKK